MLAYLAMQVRDNVVACDTPALTADEIKVVDDVRSCLPACVKASCPVRVREWPPIAGRQQARV